jgi:hypothetical protein
MKALVNSMGMYWLILLIFSLGAAAGIYYVWLKDTMLH